jgi:2-amino-4-hydroxy-6-hydroxymethyldihydropteridine diphosphokinase
VSERIRVYIGLGANVGSAQQTLERAVAAVGRLPGVHVAAVSPLYRTKPVGLEDQPDFLNAVAALDVDADPDANAASELLVALKGLERDLGRQRRGRWGPRELDLDLLLFGGARLAIERPSAAIPASAGLDRSAAPRLLEVPHREISNRLFVLAPLADLAPSLVPPGWSETVEARRRRLEADEPDAVARIAEWDDRGRGWT